MPSDQAGYRLDQALARMFPQFSRSRIKQWIESGDVLLDGKPTRLFFLLVSPESHPSLHLRWLAHLAVLLKSMSFRQALLEAETTEDILTTIDAEEQERAAEGSAGDQ